MEEKTSPISWQDFEKLEMRVGTIIQAEEFKEARNPAYKVIVDFGDYGKRKSSAQITKLYQREELIGKQVIAVVNFPPKQIANMMSECLILGTVDVEEVTLLTSAKHVKDVRRVG